jgi:hypothetical protein
MKLKKRTLPLILFNWMINPQEDLAKIGYWPDMKISKNLRTLMYYGYIKYENVIYSFWKLADYHQFLEAKNLLYVFKSFFSVPKSVQIHPIFWYSKVFLRFFSPQFYDVAKLTIIHEKISPNLAIDHILWCRKHLSFFLFCVFWLPIGAYYQIIIIISKYCKQRAFFSQKSLLCAKITFFMLKKCKNRKTLSTTYYSLATFR